MRRCLELAQRAKGYTAPNPMVGAVLVYNDRIIGEGWHHFYGSAHAEVNCLNSVPEVDRHLIPESTMYVSLEPCAHYGHTPPCAVRLVEEKIKEVIICNTDPFEKVSGRGIQILKEANTTVQTGIIQQEGLWVNRRFFCFHSQKRPYIILKWAQTPEGFIAPEDKSRFAISNSNSQQLVHKWRTEEGAIMVGTTTAATDNPLLTARLWKGKQPLRIVLDKSLKLPATLNVFNEDAATWVINEEKETLQGNVHYVQLPFDDTLLPALLARLHTNNILSMIVEGGAQLLQSFINAGLWDEARIFKGSRSLANGIAAPLLQNSTLAFQTQMEDDLLQVFTNNKSAYPYAQGMEL